MMLKDGLIQVISPKIIHLAFQWGKTKKVIEMFKDECGGKIMTEFAALRPKVYYFLVEDGKGEKKAKGVKKCVVKKGIET